MGRGKSGSKKEIILNDGHGLTTRLPPAPSSKDLSAIPNKLKRIMELTKAMSAGGADASKTRDSPKPGKRIAPTVNAKSGKLMRGRRKGVSDATSTKPETGEKLEPNLEDGLKQVGEGLVDVNEGSRKKKRKRKQEDDLLALAEKFKAVPPRQGLQQKRKQYLSQKKKKRRMGNKTDDAVPLNEYEKIEFGEVVQAPPKLSFPTKAMLKVDAVSQERKRLAAIEAYRAKRKWDFRTSNVPYQIEAQPTEEI